MKEFSIKDVPDFSRIVVVGVIGKSEYEYPNKTTPLLPSVDCDEVSFTYYYTVIFSLLTQFSVEHNKRH